jgi:hypothetical protein
MATIKDNHSGKVFQVSQNPVWIYGVWECGDQRFTDIDQSAYTPTLDYALQTPAQFYGTFKVSEMVAIKDSSDPYVKEFFARFQVFQAGNQLIDPNTVTVQEGLQYLAANPAATPILASQQRIIDICNGVLQ